MFNQSLHYESYPKTYTEEFLFDHVLVNIWHLSGNFRLHQCPNSRLLHFQIDPIPPFQDFDYLLVIYRYAICSIMTNTHLQHFSIDLFYYTSFSYAKVQWLPFKIQLLFFIKKNTDLNCLYKLKVLCLFSPFYEPKYDFTIDR